MDDWDDWDDTSEHEAIDPLSDFVALHTASTPEELWRVLTMPGFLSGAAASALRRDPGRFATIRARAQTLGGQDGAAISSGLLDAIEALDADTALKAIAFGLDWPLGSVRLLALDLLAARDLVAARRRAATDPDRRVRAWTGPRARWGDSSGAAGRERGNSKKRVRASHAGQDELFPET